MSYFESMKPDEIFNMKFAWILNEVKIKSEMSMLNLNIQILNQKSNERSQK